ncbi:MAG: amidase, partial [Anaerolineales bacterium]
MNNSAGRVPESLPQLAAALRSGDLPLADYLAVLEARFADVEPSIHAFMPGIERFARLRGEAEALEKRWPAPAGRPPLFGVAVGVKDIMRVDGLPTTAGSQLPPEEFEGPESACVSLLRAAGALMVGKTVSTEFAYFGPGPTRNPRNIDHTPGGSSSGSAAAVAAGLAPLTLGTQTVGSLIRPAAFCGVVGYKPSYDRISKKDVIPLSPSL